MSKTENYTITFIGATPNQAQAVNGVIASILQLKGKDEMPIRKYESELKTMYDDYILFKDVHVVISNMMINNLKEQIEKRMEYYDNEIKTRETAIKNHKSNIAYIDAYIKKIRSHIKENVNANTKTVVYTYDMTYITPFLDLAMIVFEMSFEEPKPSAEAEKAS
jgi:chaperonin cofactor prefoldin